MNSLNKNYHAEIDTITKQEWAEIIHNFNDATIYQTLSYGSVHWGEDNLSHFILKKENDIISAAQVRLVKVPLINAGITYIAWGPMWEIPGKEADPEVLLCLRYILYEYRRRYPAAAR